PAALPSLPARSCTALSCAFGSVLSAPLLTLHPAPAWLRPRYNFVVPALHDLSATAILPALRLKLFPNIPPAFPGPRLPSTSAATPHSRHIGSLTPEADQPRRAETPHTACSVHW